MSSATTVNTADTTGSGAAVPIMLTELRLPTIKRLWADLAAQSNREGWPAERLLHTLLGHEMAERLGMTLFGRAANRHFLCYTGFERFDAEPEPRRAAMRVVAG